MARQWKRWLAAVTVALGRRLGVARARTAPFLRALWVLGLALVRCVAAAVSWPLRRLRRHPTLAVALAVLAVIGVVLGPVLWWIGGWALIQETTGRALTAFRRIADTDPEKTVEAYGKLVAAMGLLAAAPIGLLGVGLAFWRTWNQHRDGVLAARKLGAESYAKAAESYAKAVDHLGSEKAAVRMGAILALEALGKAEPRLLSQTIEILCAFVRENRAVPTAAPDAGEATSIPVRMPTDIQLIVAIIDRLKRQDAGNRIQVDLSGANLSGANLSGANLMDTILSGAILAAADLRKADLCRATLSRANLKRTNLSGADLYGADLSRASLCSAFLYGAMLRRADLSEADLSEADLSEANLKDAILSGTHLHEAIFRYTRLPNDAVWSGKGPPPAPARAARVAAPVP